MVVFRFGGTLFGPVVVLYVAMVIVVVFVVLFFFRSCPFDRRTV